MSYSNIFHIGEDFSKAIVHGVCGIFKAMWHGVERVGTDIDVFQFNKLKLSWGDKIRFVEDIGVAVYDVSTSKNTGPLLEIITEILVKYDELFQKKAHYQEADLSSKALGFSLGRYILGPILVKRIATSITKTIALRLSALAAEDAASFAIPFLGPCVLILTLEGLMDKASKSSRRLKGTFPDIYIKLRAKHLDMLYFLVEKPMQKYTNTIRYARMFPDQFKLELLKLELHES